MKKLFYVFTLSFLFITFCFGKEENFSKNSLLWQNIKPLEHFNGEQLKLFRENDDMEELFLRVGNHTLSFLFPKQEVVYSIPKFNNDSRRILVSLLLNLEDKQLVLDSVCADTRIKDFTKWITYNGPCFAMQVLNEKGEKFLLISENLIEKLILEELGSIQVGYGFFDSSFDTFLKDPDYYFWDNVSKKIWCYITEERRFSDTCNSLSQAIFFYEKTDKVFKKLFVAEGDKNDPRYESVWQCSKHDLLRVK